MKNLIIGYKFWRSRKVLNEIKSNESNTNITALMKAKECKQLKNKTERTKFNGPFRFKRR